MLDVRGQFPNLNQSLSQDNVSFETKEQNIRTWIARKESVCPYAPGLAQFVQLPEINAIDARHIEPLAHALQNFYDAKANGKRVGRWMLLPHREWTTHREAHEYSENLFWLLNAAYFDLCNDTRSRDLALKKRLKGYDRGHNQEILNPIVGKLPKRRQSIVPGKSLFYSALSPLYRSKQFYRYSPHALVPLVYASEFHELTLRHPKVTEKVTFEMAYGGLYESFGDALNIDIEQLRIELPTWGTIIDRTALAFRASRQNISPFCASIRGCPATNLLTFRDSGPDLTATFFRKNHAQLPVLSSLVKQTGDTVKNIIAAAFAGSGLYVTPYYGKTRKPS